MLRRFYELSVWRYELHVYLAVFSSHSEPTHGQSVLALTTYRWTSASAASALPPFSFFFNLSFYLHIQLSL